MNNLLGMLGSTRSLILLHGNLLEACSLGILNSKSSRGLLSTAGFGYTIFSQQADLVAGYSSLGSVLPMKLRHPVWHSATSRKELLILKVD